MNKQNFTIVSFILVFVVLCTIEAVPARGCNTTVIANDLPDVEPIKYRDEYSFIGRISDNLPKLEITVADTGIYSGNSQRENVLSVTITAQDNSFSQQLLYQYVFGKRLYACCNAVIFASAISSGTQIQNPAPKSWSCE